MIVLGLAVLILGIFITAGILTSHPPQSPATGTGSSAVAGSLLRAVPAAPTLSVITQSGEPPANIVNAVFIPLAAVRVSHQDNNSAAGQFDAQVGLRADASQGALLDFFSSVMKHQGWQVFSRGPALHHPGALEVLGKLAGSDSYYWEMGAVISPTTFGHGAPPAGRTQFTVRLFQVPDPA
jgi:hypothetical protein